MYKLIDRKLRSLYLGKRLSINEINKKIFNCYRFSKGTIRNRLKKMNILRNISEATKLVKIRRRKVFEKELNNKRLYNLYFRKKLTPRLIKENLKCKQSSLTIRRRCKELGFARDKSEASKIAFETGRKKISLNICKYKWKSDLKHSVLSNWEANVCRFLKFMKIKYLYEPKIFRMEIWNKITTYRPDIYLPDFDLWIEVKGWKKSFSMLKIKKFGKTHTILIIDGNIYEIIKEIFKDKIKNWED